MSEYLIRVCSGSSDDEVSVTPVDINAAAFEERKEIATNIARGTAEDAVDILATEDCSRTYCINEMSPGRFCILVDGVALHNVHVCL